MQIRIDAEMQREKTDKRHVITQDRLKELLHYNPETGIFTRNLFLSNRTRCGGMAGTAHSAGYITISVDNKKYFTHRLAFLYMEGYIPENQVDHINRIRDDNRWINLREVSHSCNMRNASVGKNNTSGVTGVSWDKASNKWRAIIRVLGINKHLGIFESFNDAVTARWNGEVKYGYPNCNTTSSAYEYLKEHFLIKE